MREKILEIEQSLREIKTELRNIDLRLHAVAAEYGRHEVALNREGIIRCRDCICWDTNWSNDFSPDYHYCSLVDGIRKGDFYCADARRKDND